MRLATFVAAAVFGALAPGAALADIHVFQVSLDGVQEVPQSGSPGTGTATVTVDDVTRGVTITGNYTGVLSAVTDAHLHGLAPAGQEAGILLALQTTGGTTGTFNGSGTLSTTNLTGLFNELTYLNVHTIGFPGGEIRGQVLVPEPATASLLAGGLFLLLRRRTRLS